MTAKSTTMGRTMPAISPGEDDEPLSVCRSRPPELGREMTWKNIERYPSEEDRFTQGDSLQ